VGAEPSPITPLRTGREPNGGVRRCRLRPGCRNTVRSCYGSFRPSGASFVVDLGGLPTNGSARTAPSAREVLAVCVFVSLWRYWCPTGPISLDPSRSGPKHRYLARSRYAR
jgi:hypothetical protein